MHDWGGLQDKNTLGGRQSHEDADLGHRRPGEVQVHLDGLLLKLAGVHRHLRHHQQAKLQSHRGADPELHRVISPRDLQEHHFSG